MQGRLTIEKEWKAINDLRLIDINGNVLAIDVQAGDTVRFLSVTNDLVNTVYLWQGAQPNPDNILGAIPLEGTVVFGVGADDVYIRTLSADKDVTIEIIEGA